MAPNAIFVLSESRFWLKFSLPAFHSAGKGSRLTMGLMSRQRCRVQIVLFLCLQLQKGPKQRAYLPYLACAVSCCLFAHNKEWTQSLKVSRGSLISTSRRRRRSNDRLKASTKETHGRPRKKVCKRPTTREYLARSLVVR